MGKQTGGSSRAKAGTVVKSPEDAARVLSAYKDKRQEHFLVVSLDGASRVIRTRVVTIGLCDKALVSAREVFYPAIVDNAARIIVAHNHPSGSVEPSKEDDDVTERLASAGRLLGIPVIDHVILAKKAVYSYARSGKLVADSEAKAGRAAAEEQ